MYLTALKSGEKNHFLDNIIPAKNGVINKLDQGIVFKHDISKGIPLEYGDCDVFYTDITWSRGMKKFNEMAGAETVYKDYIEMIVRIIENIKNRPFFIVAGLEHKKHFIKADWIQQTMLNGTRAYVYSFNNRHPYNTEDLFSFIKNLSEDYECIGDFCCGLGRTGRVFKENGKRFVMSDINGKCITFLSQGGV